MLSDERMKEIRLLVTEWPTYGDEGHDAVVDLLAENAALKQEMIAHTTDDYFGATDLRAEVERLRAENSTLIDLTKKYQTEELHTLTVTKAKLAQAIDDVTMLGDKLANQGNYIEELEATLAKAVAGLDDALAFLASLNCNDYSVELENERANLVIAMDQTLKEIGE